MAEGTKEHPYQLILMDYNMPVVDGLEATRQLTKLLVKRGLNPTNHAESPYICCVSGYTEKQFEEQALAAGMHGYLSKPAGQKDIQQLLEKLGLAKQRD